MRFLLALTAAASLAACSHNKAQTNAAPETGRVATDTAVTTGVKPAMDTSATAKVAPAATDTMPHTPAATPDSAKAPVDSVKAPHDSM